MRRRDAPHAEQRIRALTKSEFALLQAEIYRQSGICLPNGKKALLAGRLRKRLRALNLRSFGDYYRLTKRDEAERRTMLDCISTNETRFFREPRHFEFIERRVIPEWIAAAERRLRSKRLRVWSAACSTGEEPYSIAMVLLKHLGASHDWSIEILATDISTRALEKARQGLWHIERASEIPLEYLQEYMLRGTGLRADTMKVGLEARAVVRFERFNLHRDVLRDGERFDLIFCRNVLMYFDAPARAATVERLSDRLAAGGYLFVGHSESLLCRDERLNCVKPTIFARADRRAPATPRWSMLDTAGIA
ncbi:MAG: protein-glutamate O-methyltransferase CheR [Vicinamibacteria bacterium]|nr:protein-glutamate O-methyltransferase CheR [Vicinamibacteria bacterium]